MAINTEPRHLMLKMLLMQNLNVFNWSLLNCLDLCCYLRINLKQYVKSYVFLLLNRFVLLMRRNDYFVKIPDLLSIVGALKISLAECALAWHWYPGGSS